jgi:hypothetical protein
VAGLERGNSPVEDRGGVVRGILVVAGDGEDAEGNRWAGVDAAGDHLGGILSVGFLVEGRSAGDGE